MALPKISESQWILMEALWEHSPQTALKLTGVLESSTHWTENTVRTMLTRLCDKGALNFGKNAAGTRTFRPTVSREAACDDEVLPAAPRSRRTASGHTMLKMETACPASGVCLGFVGILRQRGTLRARIQAILKQPTLKSNGSAALVTGMLITTLLGVTLHTYAEPPAVASGKAQPEANALPKLKKAAPEPSLFVVRKGGKEGFINPQGKLVIRATFQKAYPFKGGLAAVQIENRWGFIDDKGKMVIQPRFAMVGFFSEGLASYRNTFLGHWGYINKKGEVVIEPRFDTAEEFHNGVARVGFETPAGKLLSYVADAQLVPLDYRFITPTGAFVEDPGPTRLATGEPGELILFEKDGKYGYVDATGKVVIPARFTSALPFSDGLACALEKDLFGYIDKSGKFVIQPRFRYSNDFSEGLAGVPLGPKGWGFIDKSGKTVIPPRFGWVYSGFRHGIAEVTFDGKAGYIDKQGKWVWPPSE